MKVLIIDDSLFTLNNHSQLVAEAGMQPLTAEGGEQALQIYEQQQPQIVLCDIMMPEMDGYETMEAIKEIDPEVFFYIISAEMTTAAQKKSLDIGAAGFFQKPIDAQSIQQIIAKYQSTLDKSTTV